MNYPSKALYAAAFGLFLTLAILASKRLPPVFLAGVFVGMTVGFLIGVVYTLMAHRATLRGRLCSAWDQRGGLFP